MKKIILISILLLGYISQVGAISVITGKWNKPGSTICFYKVEDGALVQKATYAIDSSMVFGFAIPIEKEGFYVIGSDNMNNTQNKYTFYLKPEDKLNVEFSATNYNLIGNNTAENLQMKKWFDLTAPISSMSLNINSKTITKTYVDFFPALEEVIENINSTVFEPTGNATFNESFSSFRDFDLKMNAITFLFVPRSTHPQEEDFPEYYQELTLKNSTKSATLMDYPFGQRLLHNLGLQETLNRKKANPDLNPTDYMGLIDLYLPEIEDKVMKGELVLSYAKYMKTVEGLLNLQNKFGKQLTTESQKERFRELLNSKAKNNKGDLAIDFKFPDIDGKEIALSDYKGKVVYVDIWATWCAPCKKEIPYLKELEKEYKGKNIVFMGVSVDDPKDKAKWQKFLVDNKMDGLQIFAGDKEKDIKDPYKIKTIPRFLLIDKDGRIVSANAPRPSSSEIRILLDATLNKK